MERMGSKREYKGLLMLTEAQRAPFAWCVLAETVWGQFYVLKNVLAMLSRNVKASQVAPLCRRPISGLRWSGFEGRVAAVGFVFADPVMESQHS